MDTIKAIKTKKYKVVTAGTASLLNEAVKQMILDGWKPKGSHSVVETKHQLQYAGNQHMRTIISYEYAQTMVKVSSRMPKGSHI